MLEVSIFSHLIWLVVRRKLKFKRKCFPIQFGQKEKLKVYELFDENGRGKFLTSSNQYKGQKRIKNFEEL